MIGVRFWPLARAPEIGANGPWARCLAVVHGTRCPSALGVAEYLGLVPLSACRAWVQYLRPVACAGTTARRPRAGRGRGSEQARGGGGEDSPPEGC